MEVDFGNEQIKCITCGKSVDRTGLAQKYCKDCAKERTKIRQRAYQKMWRKKNEKRYKEISRKSSKAWHQKNPERYKEYQREYYYKVRKPKMQAAKEIEK